MYSPRNPVAGSAPRAGDAAAPMRIPKAPSKASWRFIDPPSFFDQVPAHYLPTPDPGSGSWRGPCGSNWFPMNRRARKLWIALTVLAIGLAVAAWLSVHVIVSSRLLRNWVNGAPKHLFLDYEEASAWVPGIIRLRGLTMRGSDPNVEWSFRMERATIAISVLDLLRRQFHATSVRAQGLVFRLREKEEKKEMSRAHLALLPAIPGYSDPPTRTPAAEPPRLSAREKRRLWSVHVEDLVADPTPELWIEIYRFRGHARVTGSFLLRPHVEARVGPAAAEFLSGVFTLGPRETILSGASGHGDCVIDPFEQDEVHGQEIWRRISGSIRVEGRVQDLRFVNHFIRRTPEPRL